MDDSKFVGMGQNTADLFGYENSAPRFQSTRPDLPVESVRDVLHDYVGGFVLDLKGVDSDDVGVV